MKLIKVTISFLTLLLFSFNTIAQANQEKGSLNSGTIDSQFDYLYKKSPKWEDYKSVKINNLLNSKKTFLIL